MIFTYQQLIFSTAEEENYFFSGEKSSNLNTICTSNPIDGEFFRVEEGSLPEVISNELTK